MAKEVQRHYWEIIVWFESCPSIDGTGTKEGKQKYIISVIESIQVKAALSPLHDRDIYDHDDADGKFKEGDTKKAHWHLLLYYHGSTTKNAVLEIASFFNSKSIQWKIYPVESYEYLDHHKVVSKYKPLYDEPILNLCGLCIDDYRHYSDDEVENIVVELEKTIIKYDIREYSDFIIFTHKQDDLQLHKIARSKTIHFKAFIDSRRNKLMLNRGDNGEK